MLDVIPIAILKDNYVWLVRRDGSQKTVILDPGDAAPVHRYLSSHQLELEAILITHRHWDHTDGVAELVKEYRCPVYGPHSPAIPQITHHVYPGGTVCPSDGLEFGVTAIPGHTEEHIGYLLKEEGRLNLFCGDTLFSAGCGRLLGGTATQLKHSLDAIKELPAHTRIYCTHEYTLPNLEFAKTVMPTNQHLEKYIAVAQRARNAGQPTVPTILSLECDINPFLRCETDEVQQAVAQHFSTTPGNALETFTRLRQWKDNF